MYIDERFTYQLVLLMYAFVHAIVRTINYFWIKPRTIYFVLLITYLIPSSWRISF